MKNLFLAMLIITIMISGLVTICSMHFGEAQSGTNVSGLISQDTMWTQGGSPYTFTDNMAVNQGVTLTIEAGTTVNLSNYYLRVNGTLNAVGSANSKVTFNGGQITFTTLSNGWTETSKNGCIIENSIINQVSVSCSNPIKIDNCIINSQNSQIIVASSIISNNVVTGNIRSQSSTPSLGQSNSHVDTSVISGNTVNGNIVLGAVSLGAVTAPSEACSVFNNTVYGSIISGSPQDTPQIYNNTVSGGGIQCTGYGSIFNNYIHGCQKGISLYATRVFGGYLPCYATVENNLIEDNTQGIDISLASVFGPGTKCPTILNNTILENSVGIYLSESYYNSAPTIQNNNLQNNSNYNFYLQAQNNVNATNNYWGTTNTQAINQTIYDFKNDFNLGVVTFSPFSTAPNPQAPNAINPIVIPSPTASSTPTQNPTSTTSTPALSPTPASTSTVPEFSALIFTPLFAAVFFAVIAFKAKDQKAGGNMKRLNFFRILTVMLTFVIISSIITQSASAQSLPKPSVPQFSIQVVDHSYDILTTYYPDPFTGKQLTNPGYHVNDIRVEGKIKNQHFTAYTMPNPNSTSNTDTYLKIDFYYSIRYKGHFESEWRQLYGTRDLDFLKQNYGSEYTNFTATNGNAIEFQDGDVVDFQVKAIIGYETWGFVATFPYRILNGEESGWSNILTVTISTDLSSTSNFASTIDNSAYPKLTSPQSISTPTSTPLSSPTPSVPELSRLALLPLCLIVLFVALVLGNENRPIISKLQKKL